MPTLNWIGKEAVVKPSAVEAASRRLDLEEKVVRGHSPADHRPETPYEIRTT